MSFSQKKKLCENPEKTEAIKFLRNEKRSLREICRLLHLKTSTLAEWNGIFDAKMRPITMPDRRGKTAKVTADLVRVVVELARTYKADNKRLRLKAFTRHLASNEINLSSKTVSEILIANDLYGVKVKKRRPHFYQNLRQTIPNGLVAVDGKEFVVFLGVDEYRFNLELCVDVKSFLHSGFSIADTETTEEFIKVMDMHRTAWGSPLAVVTDHGTANLSSEARAFLESHDIEPLPAGPGNPKGNGSVEGAFSQMAGVIGTICIDQTSSRAMAQSVLEKIVEVYIHLRNRVPQLGANHSPTEEMSIPVATLQRTKQKEHYHQRAKQQDKTTDHTDKHDRLHWLIDHHQLSVDAPSMARAEKCIAYYDLVTIAKAEAAFCVAISRDNGRKNLPYFFGIIRNIQKETDTAQYEDYCRRRYNYLQMIKRERQQNNEESDQLVPEVLVDMLHNAISLPSLQLKEIALRQAKEMVVILQKQYRSFGILKNKVMDILTEVSNITLDQRKEIIALTEQFAT